MKPLILTLGLLICLLAGIEAEETGPATNSDRFPNWSPDGSKIAFYSDRDGRFQVADIYVMNADGNEQVNLSQSPRWAPDDRRIAFVSDRDGNAEIYVLDCVNTADPAASGPRGHDPQAE